MASSHKQTSCPCASGLIFHELFCYDVYVVSAPAPQNTKQKQIDEYMTDNIVNPLEQDGFKCYFGSRDIPGGEFVIQSLSKPITIIPITIVPVYKDRRFTAHRNLLLRPDYLDRIVFLLFDSTEVEPPAVARNSFSIAFNDKHLLRKLIQTIEKRSKQIPLDHRRKKFGNDPDGIVFLESMLTLPIDLLSHRHNCNQNIRHQAANSLAKLIQRDIIHFIQTDDLPCIEKQVRYWVEKQNSDIFEKLYFWISAAIFFRIYKYNDLNLKRYMKNVTVTKYKTRYKSYEQLCLYFYRKCTVSLHAKIKTWPRKLDNNSAHIRKFEESLSMIDPKSSDKATTPPQSLMKIITNLPWDIRHIFIVAISEKLFQKKYTESKVSFFTQICAVVVNKHTEVFLDVIERVTEYILENCTEDALMVCLQLLETGWMSRRKRIKYDKLKIILKNSFSKLVYHPVDKVRYCVTPLLFFEDSYPNIVSELGNTIFKVNEDLVEICICEHLIHNHPDITLGDQMQTTSPHSLIFEAKTPEGDVLVYVFKQTTLNDVLQTNSTDDSYERFQGMSMVVKACQGHDNIAALRNEPTSGVLPFFVVEHGKPLLLFLHEKENQLTLLQMIEILIHITKATHHCHSKNVILCDITPASFIIFPKDNGSFQTKLANFMYAKCPVNEDSNGAAQGTIEDINHLSFQGDNKEDVAAYFSAPETLANKNFSKYSDAWMLAATFYSVLLYGRCPFQELAHLNVFDFVNEIKANHTACSPSPFPPDLWKILETNLDFEVEKRMLTEIVLNQFETYKNNLGTRGNALYTVRTMCRYINPGDILRGHVDANGNFILKTNEEPFEETYADISQLGEKIIDSVSVRMSLNTRRKLLKLSHENILKIEEIRTDSYKTTLISNKSDGHIYTLSEIAQDIENDQFFSYMEQITCALQYLHDHNILHCDMRCSSMYVNPEKGTVKLGHFGRAVSLEGRQTFPYVFKMMPNDAERWSAPEVRANGMYSKASDVFNLAAVFWEWIITQEKAVYQNDPLRPFRGCSHMEEYANCTNLKTWDEDINKLLRFMQKCWTPNPTKRPTPNVIIDIIKQIRTEDEQYWLVSGDTVSDDSESGGEDDVYERIIENSSPDFSVCYAWGKVVKELVVCQGIQNDPTSRIDVIDMSTSEKVDV
ncbi:uncharacterized protein LOC135057350 [Pseudophryne corroboree]|uniref:uncharacterized protein LOC135057350 n=1 Tax=Pseudophryne corroboree TaxID=495146 RepID=UPI003081A2A1